MAESEGAGSDEVDDIDWIRGYAVYAPRVVELRGHFTYPHFESLREIVMKCRITVRPQKMNPRYAHATIFGPFEAKS